MGNTGSTSLQRPDVAVWSDCPSFNVAEQLAEKDPLFYCARTTYDIHARGTYW